MYALSKKDQAIYFRNLVSDVILLAPCVFLNEPISLYPGYEPVSVAGQLYISYERTFDLYDQMGVFVYSGPNSEVDATKICQIFGKMNPECRRAKKPSGFGQPFSTKA